MLHRFRVKKTNRAVQVVRTPHSKQVIPGSNDTSNAAPQKEFNLRRDMKPLDTSPHLRISRTRGRGAVTPTGRKRVAQPPIPRFNRVSTSFRSRRDEPISEIRDPDLNQRDSSPRRLKKKAPISSTLHVLSSVSIIEAITCDLSSSTPSREIG